MRMAVGARTLHEAIRPLSKGSKPDEISINWKGVSGAQGRISLSDHLTIDLISLFTALRKLCVSP